MKVAEVIDPLNKLGRVTIAWKPSHDLAAGTLNSIWKQAGLKGVR